MLYLQYQNIESMASHRPAMKKGRHMERNLAIKTTRTLFARLNLAVTELNVPLNPYVFGTFPGY